MNFETILWIICIVWTLIMLPYFLRVWGILDSIGYFQRRREKSTQRYINRIRAEYLLSPIKFKKLEGKKI